MPEDRHVGQGHQEPVPDQQVTSQRPDGATEQLGIADVQDQGARHVLALLLPEHIAGFARYQGTHTSSLYRSSI